MAFDRIVMDRHNVLSVLKAGPTATQLCLLEANKLFS